MKFKYLSILIAIASLALLYVFTLFSHPTLISLSAIPTYNGQQVIVQGIVTEYRTTTYGSQLITIRDTENTTTSVMLYIEGIFPVEFGDKIQAIGEVQQYNDQWEISVNNPQFLTIVEKWNNSSIPLWQLAKNPERYLDTNVNVTGVATHKQKTSFSLSDSSQTYTIDVVYDASFTSTFSNDDVVVVAGRFVYEPQTLHYLLKVTESSHGIWKSTG
jgi:cytochrome c-type biogenesis protein CcmE